MRKKLLLFLMLLMPFNVLAYSDKIVVSGENIGIVVHSKGVYVIDFYKVNNKNIAKDAGFMKGDIIIQVENNDINSINEFNRLIDREGKYSVKVKRDDKVIDLNLNVIKEENIYKTGIYVKDQINGIGTLSYVDPETHIFASLGHEILESSNSKIFEMNNGYIYDIEINSINKNQDRNIGELHAKFSNKLLGEIDKNKVNGIYGKYTSSLDDVELIDVAKREEIKSGKAFLKLRLDNSESKLYSINILSVNENEDVKNILFEIDDRELLNKTGGVVQGMSGSPIIQNNKIIGVVNYVVVDDSKKGYGVFIETMLLEGDKLLNE